MEIDNYAIWVGPAVSGDGNGVAAVHKATWLVTYPNIQAGITKKDILSMANFFDNDEHIKEWEEKISTNGKNDYYVCVAKSSGRVVAFCAAQKFKAHNQIMALYIAPGFQKRGIGKRLLGRVFEWIGRDKKIIVTPVEYNYPAVSFYEKVGFKKVGQKFLTKQMPTGKTLRMVEMEICPRPLVKKYLITDIDGTIFDRIPGYCSVFAGLMEKEGIPFEFAQNYYYGSQGMAIADQVNEILARFDLADFKRSGRIIREFWDAVSAIGFDVFPDAKETLLRAKDFGIGIFASSGSYTSELEKHIKKFGLSYDIILGGNIIKKGDGHIDFFAGRLGLGVGEFCRDAVFVGDGPVDMQIASRNNILAVGITNTLPAEKLVAAGAAATIGNFTEILDFFGNVDTIR